MNDILDNEKKIEKRPWIKFKLAIILFIIAFSITFKGTLFKIQSWNRGSEFITIGILLLVLSLLIFIIKLVSYKNPKSLLNK